MRLMNSKFYGIVSKFDNVFVGWLKPWFKFWYAVTGWPSLRLSRFFFYIGAALMSVYYIDSIAFDHEWYRMLIAAIWTWNFSIYWKNIHIIHRETEKLVEHGTLSMDLIDAVAPTILVRALFLLLLTVAAPFETIMMWNTHNYDSAFFDLGLLFTAFALYNTTFYSGGGKTVWRKAYDKVKSKLQDIKLPELVPTPQPVGLHANYCS